LFEFQDRYSFLLKKEIFSKKAARIYLEVRIATRSEFSAILPESPIVCVVIESGCDYDISGLFSGWIDRFLCNQPV